MEQDWKPEDISTKSDGGIIRYVSTSTNKNESPKEGDLVEGTSILPLLRNKSYIFSFQSI